VQGPYRIAIVGVGKIACDQHVPALRATPEFDLVATASRHGSIDGVPAYPDLAALLADVEVDAVSICTPPAHRREIVTAALAAGVHVMLEKPPAVDLATVDSMAAAARAAGRVLFTTWHSREAGAVEPARRWLQGRKVRRAHIEWRENIRQWHPGQDWILAADGFGVFDPGINALSIATAILPGPFEFARARLEIPENRAAPLAADLTFSCGEVPVVAAFDFLHEGEPCWDIRVETDDGTVMLRRGGQELHLPGDSVSFENREYPRLYDRFATLVGDAQSDVDVAPLDLALKAQRLGIVSASARFEWDG